MNTVDLFYHGAEGSQLSFFQSLGMAVYSRTALASAESSIENVSQRNFEISIKSFGVKRSVLVEDSIPQSKEINSCEGFLYYQSLTEEALLRLVEKMELDPHYRIYLVCHTYFSVMGEFEKLRTHHVDLSRVTFITGQAHQKMDLLVVEDLKKYIQDFWQNEVFHANIFKKPKSQVESTESLVSVVFFKLLFILRQFFSPLQFTERQVHRFKTVKFVWELRSKELLDFISFLISGRLYVDKNVWWIRLGELPDFLSFLFHGKTHINTSIWSIRLKDLYGFFLYFYGAYVVSNISRFYQEFRVWLIRGGFLLRHIAIISVSKVYGVFVDTYYGIKRLRFLVQPFILIRHVSLMSFYKTYGLLVDSFNFCHRHITQFYYKFLVQFYYKFLLPIYYKFFVQFYYSFLKKCYYLILQFVSKFYYNVVMKFYYSYLLKLYHFTRLKLIKGYYIVRHHTLMTFFKSYGLLVDCYYFLRLITIKGFYFLRHQILMTRVWVIRFYYWVLRQIQFLITSALVVSRKLFHFCLLISRRYILFPFFKIYWFSSYQYQKRIKGKWDQ